MKWFKWCWHCWHPAVDEEDNKILKPVWRMGCKNKNHSNYMRRIKIMDGVWKWEVKYSSKEICCKCRKVKWVHDGNLYEDRIDAEKFYNKNIRRKVTNGEANENKAMRWTSL